MVKRLFEQLRSELDGEDPGYGVVQVPAPGVPRGGPGDGAASSSDGGRTEAVVSKSSEAKIVCRDQGCIGDCGLYHRCDCRGHAGGHESEARLVPVASLVKDGKLLKSCEECRNAYNMQRQLYGRGARAAEERASAAKDRPLTLGIRHTAAEQASIAVSLLDPIRDRVGMAPSPDLKAYVFDHKGVNLEFSNARIKKQIESEGMDFLSENRRTSGHGVNLVATKMDGHGLSAAEIEAAYAAGLAESLVLYVNKAGGGAGKYGVEGELIRLLGDANGGLGALSGGAVLNQSSSVGGNPRPRRGYVQTIGITLIHDLKALGLVLRDAAGRKVPAAEAPRRLVVPVPRAAGALPVAIRPSDSVSWARGETYEEFLQRARDQSDRWDRQSPLARLECKLGVRNELSDAGGEGWRLEKFFRKEPEAPEGWFDGIDELIARGEVDAVHADERCFRALNAEEAAVVRAAKASGDPRMPLLFGRPPPFPGEQLTAEQWAAEIVSQVESGSRTQTMAVSCSVGSGHSCVALATSAVEGRVPGGMVISFVPGHMTDGRCVRVGGSKLVAAGASSKAAAAALRLREAVVMCPFGFGVYEVVYDAGAVLHGCSLGEPSSAPVVPWYIDPARPPFRGAVFVFTRVHDKVALTAGIRERGGEVVPKFSGRVTVVVADDERTDSDKLRQATKRVPALPVLTVDELRAAFAKVPVTV
jgi:hypothetical protein